MSKKALVSVDDIHIQDDVSEVISFSDEDIMAEAKIKFAGFIDDINAHLNSLKEEDYELYVIGAAQNVEGLKSEIELSLEMIAASNALNRLESESEDFKTLRDSYIVDRAKSLSTVLTSRRPLSYDVRSLTEQSLSAIGFFQEFLYAISVQNTDKTELIQNSISLSLYKKSIDIVNGWIAERESK